MSVDTSKTRPAVWVGDLRDLPALTAVSDFWTRFGPSVLYIELDPKAEEYIAVVVSGHLMAVRCANDGNMVWVHDRGLHGADREAFNAAIQSSDLFDNRVRGTKWFM